MTVTEQSERSATLAGAADTAPRPTLGRRWTQVLVVLVVAVLVIVPFTAGEFTLTNFSLAMVYGLGILSLDVVMGQTGQVSLGHGGLMGVGAYTSALLINYADLNPYVTLLVAPFTTAVLGIVLATAALRLSGLYLVLATFALALVVPQLAMYFRSYTGGTEGLVITNLESPIAGLSNPQWLYFFLLFVGMITLGVTRIFLSGRTRRALNAIRDNPRSAVACGIDMTRYKILAFIVSSFIAGLAGGLFALFTAFVSPSSFTFTLSLLLFTGLGIAGTGSIAAPLVGGLIIVYLPLASSWLYGGKPDLSYGAIIIALVLVGKGGIVDLLARIARQLLQVVGRFDRTRTIRNPASANRGAGIREEQS